VSLDPAEVLKAAAEWVWVPPDAREVRTEEFRVIAYPAHFADPTVATSWESTRAGDQVIDDVLAVAKDLGRGDVTFVGLSDSTSPADLEKQLLARGARLSETLAVLARDLTAGLPDLDPPADLELRPAADLESRRAMDRLEVAVFGGEHQSDEALAAEAEVAARGEEQDPRVLAWRDGVAVGTAGHVVAGDVLRLWGGCVLPEARHTGVYRALLDHRLRAGRDAGCRMALVKGRVETSAPVLRRAGFEEYGEERSYRLPAA
jgi:GNAT superfamily N-acetyltransferase